MLLMFFVTYHINRLWVPNKVSFDFQGTETQGFAKCSKYSHPLDNHRFILGCPLVGSIPGYAGFSHTKDFKNGSDPCLHGTHDEVGITKHNWSAR